jgi:uncharacterized protein YdaU (DUF1376 family)
MFAYYHHIGDYIRDTSHLSLLEHGAYRMLIDFYYQQSGKIPGERFEICRLLRCRNRAEREAVIKMLEEFFTYESDRYIHKRCDKEIAKIIDKSEKAKAKANKRWKDRAPQQ